MKLGFDAICLAAVCSESQVLIGSRLERIFCLDDSTLVLGAYGEREHWLLLSVDASRPRAHLMARRPSAPKEQPEFVKMLRRHLTEAKIVFLRQRGLDRVLDIGFIGETGPWQLAVELTGRFGVMALVGADRRVAAANRFFGSHQSVRPLLAGQPYEPPPAPTLPLITEAKPGDDLKEFQGSSPTLRALIDAGLELSDVQEALASRTWQPHALAGMGAYPLPFPGGQPRPSFSAAYELHLGETIGREGLESARASLLGQLKRARDSRQRALKDIEGALTTAAKAPQIQREAELILAYQGMILEGAEELSCWDYDGSEVTLKLDPEKTALENAQTRFHRAKRAKERAEEVAEQEARIAADLRDILHLIEQLNLAKSIDDIRPLEEEAKSRRWVQVQSAPGQTKEDRPYGGFSIREMVTPGGWRALYGLNSTSNDYLTTRVAKPNDWWLHVRGGVSAHVVIQTHNQPLKVQRPDLIFAAELAVKNSPSKHAAIVDVDYTLKKHVHKPRKSPAGFVSYTREKTLSVDQRD